eukprot:6192315-Pleurochrysis_carterae.AAC.3
MQLAEAAQQWADSRGVRQPCIEIQPDDAGAPEMQSGDAPPLTSVTQVNMPHGFPWPRLTRPCTHYAWPHRCPPHRR